MIRSTLRTFRVGFLPQSYASRPPLAREAFMLGGFLTVAALIVISIQPQSFQVLSESLAEVGAFESELYGRGQEPKLATGIVPFPFKTPSVDGPLF